MNIIEYTRKLEREEENLDLLSQSEEIESIAEGIRTDISKTKVLTGIDLSNASVENLPGNTAGLYYLGKGRTKIDQELLESGDEVSRIQVLVHESMHQVNDKKSNGVKIVDVDFLESLNELATERRTGRFLADHADKSDANKIASAVGKSVNQLLSEYENGDNEKLNTYFDLAQTKKVA